MRRPFVSSSPANARVRAGREADADEWRGRLEVHGLDLRDLRGVETFCAFIADRHEALDILVNNAPDRAAVFSRRPLCLRPASARHRRDPPPSE